ncbi:hypothetical protein [Ramlibacter tataouinensis]|uniref:hypothetical protein n=1 Tax=Ramlibacter tataouinensis TaxID=94132 RepID=UPI003F7D5A51
MFTAGGWPVYMRAVSNDRLALQRADEEALRIGGVEGPGVVQARIPAFPCRPLDRQRDLVTAHVRATYPASIAPS